MPAGSRGCPAEALAPWQGHEAEPLPSVALETSPCPGSQPWCSAWSLPMARALRCGGHGDLHGQGSLPQLPAGFGTQGRAGEGSGGCCLVLRRVLSCPHCSWVASRFLLQAGGTLSGDPWPTSTRAHGPEGAARLRGAPTPCLSPPELSGVNPSGSSLRGWGRAGHRLQGLGLIQAPRCCCGAKLPRAELEGPQWGSRWGWAAP